MSGSSERANNSKQFPVGANGLRRRSSGGLNEWMAHGTETMSLRSGQGVDRTLDFTVDWTMIKDFSMQLKRMYTYGLVLGSF